jgi:DNA-binding protein H-NS
MHFNLSELSLKELKVLQTNVAKEIAGFQDRAKRQALAELEENARALGFTLAELTGTAQVRKRSPAQPKYGNPSDPIETWSGRGRQPRWFADALAAGKTPDDLAI